MAELDSELSEFAAAVSAATLTTGRRLIRNYTYYRNKNGQYPPVKRTELLSLCRHIRVSAFGLHNLLADRDRTFSPFLVSLACDVNHLLEELHRKLLFFEAKKLEFVIPELDAQRRFWSRYTEETFYHNLSNRLETGFPDSIALLEKEIRNLPEAAPY